MHRSRYPILILTIAVCSCNEQLRDEPLGLALLEREKQNILSDLEDITIPEGVKSLEMVESTDRLSIDSPEPRYQPFRNPTERVSSGGVLDTQLSIAYSNQLIWNEKEQVPISVSLRNYDGMLVGPTLRIKQGDLLRVKIKNDLPALGSTSCDPYKSHMHRTSNNPCDQKNPSAFNTTNLHTHGLHVSPKDSSDNVLVKIDPSCEFQNHIQLPQDHPQGTFWYHGHVHGSTAVQVSSGMGGALIVEGGMDTIPEIRAAEEKIFVLQQIPYTKDSADQYGVEDFDESFGPTTWDTGVEEYGWRTMINGQTYPIIYLKSGEVQRWRFIHAGVREKIDLQLEGHQLHEIALDGISLGRIVTSENVEMHPGYRSDVLMQAKIVTESETLFLIDREAQKENSLLDEYERPKVLAVVIISPEVKAMSLPANDQLAAYAPFETIKEAELEDPPEKVWFNIDGSSGTLCFTINGKPFSMDNPPRILKLNSASEWQITSKRANHPFHIHVNSFEIFRIKKANGTEKIFNPPIWRDTYLIQANDTVYVRSRYEDFDGDFVLHCHILDHEDQGMMELVSIRESETL